MRKSDIDNTFIGLLRDNKAPISIAMGEHSHTIPQPDKKLMFEISVAIKSFILRRNKKLEEKL